MYLGGRERTGLPLSYMLPFTRPRVRQALSLHTTSPRTARSLPPCYMLPPTSSLSPAELQATPHQPQRENWSLAGGGVACSSVRQRELVSLCGWWGVACSSAGERELVWGWWVVSAGERELVCGWWGVACSSVGEIELVSLWGWWVVACSSAEERELVCGWWRVACSSAGERELVWGWWGVVSNGAEEGRDWSVGQCLK